MEVEKSHSLLSANWETRKTCGMDQSKAEGLSASAALVEALAHEGPGTRAMDV